MSKPLSEVLEQVWNGFDGARLKRLYEGDLDDGDNIAGVLDELATAFVQVFSSDMGEPDFIRPAMVLRTSGLYRSRRDQYSKRDANDTDLDAMIDRAVCGVQTSPAGASGCQTVSNEWALSSMSVPTRELYERVKGVYASESGGSYQVKDLCVNACRLNGEGETEYKPLTNFVPIPVATITRTDGALTRTAYRLAGIDQRGNVLPEVDIEPDTLFELDKMTARCWSNRAAVKPWRGANGMLREAVQTVWTELAHDRTVYTSIGWHKHGGEWLYAFDGGSVGGSDNVGVEVSSMFSGRFSLAPAGADADEIRRAVRSSIDAMRGAAVHKLTFPLWSMTYLATITTFLTMAGARPAFVLALCGDTGSGKSSIAGLISSHYGKDFNYDTVPANFSGTTNSKLEQTFIAGDVLLSFDDNHRGADETENKRRAGMASSLIQQYANGTGGRTRLNRDGSPQKARPARGCGLLTMESVPNVEQSDIARMWRINLDPGDVPTQERYERRDEYMLACDQGRKVVFATALRGFIEWIRDQVNRNEQGFCADLHDLHGAFAGEFADAAHGRIPNAAGHMLLGMYMLTSYAESVKAISDAESESIMREFREILLDGVKQQGEHLKHDNPLKVFADMLDELDSTRELFLDVNENPNLDMRTVADGFRNGKELCGYRSNSLYYVKQKVLWGAMTRLARESGTFMQLSQDELWRRLEREGVIKQAKSRAERVYRDDGDGGKVDTGINARCILVYRDKLDALLKVDDDPDDDSK